MKLIESVRKMKSRGQRNPLEHVAEPSGFWFWLWVKEQVKQKRHSMTKKYDEQTEDGVHRSYRLMYGVTALIDTFCYVFWALAVSVPGDIEWNISKAVALRLGRDGPQGLNEQDQLWLRNNFLI